MKSNSKYTFRKILVISIWVLLGTGTVVLLIAAISKKYNEPVAGLEIHINGAQNNNFIDKKDVINLLEKLNGKKLNKMDLGSLNLTLMEKELRRDAWIKNAEAFFDNNNVLQIKISEREPVARIFALSGASFYIDSSLTKIPLSNRFSARLPVFTSFPDVGKVLKGQDSALLEGIKTISEYINSHPFWMAQIDQINITPAGTFELTPKLGNQLILFGNADDCEEKFNELITFYEQVQTKIGWNKYSVIDVRFKNQVVCVNRDKAEIKADSLQAVRIMKNNIEEAQKNASDSTKIQLPQSPDENADNYKTDKANDLPVLKNVPNETKAENKIQKKKSNETESTVAPIHDHEKPFIKKQISEGIKPVIRHPSSNEKPDPTPLQKKVIEKGVGKREIKKPTPEVQKIPKAVMPPKSDY